jgi:uncharacterized membrane protein (UPF0182 family)
MRYLKPGHRSWRRIVLGIFAVLVILAIVSSTIQKWLWMQNMGYTGIFRTLLFVQSAMFFAAFLTGFLYVWINLQAAMSKGLEGFTSSFFERSGQTLTPGGMKALVFLISAFIGLVFGLVFYPQWDSFLRFHYGGAFGLAEPLFGVDAGFYVMRLPFYELIQNSLTGLALSTLAIVVVAYGYFGLLDIWRGKLPEKYERVSKHLCILAFVLVASWTWGFFLDHYELLYSTVGVVYGAGYTADHVTRVSLWVMMGASLLLCAILAFNFVRPRVKWIAISAGVYGALYLISIVVLPPLVQNLAVVPNELQFETPYLKHNIEYTRKAFDLEKIKEVSYPALFDLTKGAIEKNEETIQNIRLWDWRPLLQTYRQTQEIRLYYQFYDVDVDRYRLEDGYHQVMLSPRELAQELPEKARTWVNQYLQFTHGYGIVMSFVSKIIGEGFPDYLLENIPPESTFKLAVKQPSIYFGERMPGYRIVGTKIKEFDYPKGNENVYTSYQGTGGIPLDSFWKRILFSWTQSDINILLTSYLAPGSRIQLWRNVRERVEEIAPFLVFDSDPYAVLSGGRLYWIQDAYTVSDHFPYSTPYEEGNLQSVNYIRNSVKIVVDMYDGTVDFYIMDPEDPILSAYRRAFPGVFKDLGELSEDLKQHLRYPEDLFFIQAHRYRSFHMTVPQVFYNQEDLWTFSQEKYAGTTSLMRPYYILMKLPGNEKLEYLLMTPFTPQGRDNMIAWMAARCDFPEYAKILVYELPKEKLIYGPSQIEAMIDQNTAISQQLSLWDQRGSRVIRGNLIIIPIESSFLYVEPVYLTAEGANLPQLKRVIVVSGDKVAMEPTLDESIDAVFGRVQATGSALPPAAAQQPQPDLAKARALYERAEKAIQQGNWEEFGKIMEALKGQLEKQNR